MIEISRNQANALVAGNCPVPAHLTINGIQQEYRVTQVETERSDFSLYGGMTEMKFMAELEKVPMSEVVVPLQPKKEKPELRYTELWMADTSNDMMGVMSGYLTHGKYYEVLSTHTNHFGGLVFKVVTDAGHITTYGACWFKPVSLYDEDESELICRDIEFEEGDYIDKHNWTSEQLVHLSKYYKFYRLSTACKKDLPFLIWDVDNEFVSGRHFECIGKEYTYDDIFYSEGS